MMEYCIKCKDTVDHRDWRRTKEGWICGKHFTPRAFKGQRSVRDYDPVDVFGSVAEGYKKEWLKDKKI